MTEIKPEYKIKRMPGNGKKERSFPVDVRDKEQFLRFVVEYIKLRLMEGTNQIVIHSDGMGRIMKTDEMRVNK